MPKRPTNETHEQRVGRLGTLLSLAIGPQHADAGRALKTIKKLINLDSAKVFSYATKRCGSSYAYSIRNTGLVSNSGGQAEPNI